RMAEENRGHSQSSSLASRCVEGERSFWQSHCVAPGVDRSRQCEVQRPHGVESAISTETEGDDHEFGRESLDDLNIEIVCELERALQQRSIRRAELLDEGLGGLAAPRNEIRHSHTV